MSIFDRFRRRLATGEAETVDTRLGPVTTVPCELAEGDRVEVASTASNARRKYVSIMAHEGGGQAAVSITPSAARAFAAGILNAADECDGTTPLNFSGGGS